MTFGGIKEKVLWITALVIILSWCALYQWMAIKKNNTLGTKVFYENDVYGDLTGIQRGSGGFVHIRLKNGKDFTFHPLGNFGEVVSPGDSISKPAYFFEILIFKKDTVYSFSFITPTVSQMR